MGVRRANTLKLPHLRPPKLGPRLQRAFHYAAEKHAGQTRKQTAVSYLSHLMAVASLVLEAGGDEEMGIAALLHDVGEHCGGLYGFIRRAQAGVGGAEERLFERTEACGCRYKAGLGG